MFTAAQQQLAQLQRAPPPVELLATPGIFDELDAGVEGSFCEGVRPDCAVLAQEIVAGKLQRVVQELAAVQSVRRKGRAEGSAQSQERERELSACRHRRTRKEIILK